MNLYVKVVKSERLDLGKVAGTRFVSTREQLFGQLETSGVGFRLVGKGSNAVVRAFAVLPDSDRRGSIA